ncbi:AAA domain-containing protein [Algoriphagus sp. C2-6-M1]|uniref:DEAD/DEAH box helicase n=1 Tax=Algoriphagus persicinus TaxID=3108754 RepID=UPI002B37F89C|nr:AAA domain-containing protein [Algoriphagus sp. C2-6-M1]MEB2780806.1 AAA domain-containing protein [Algoriphagus sp. C2-6-M1]
MNQKRIWKEYITAQTKILEHKSKPIGIDTSKPYEIEGQKVKVAIDQEIFKKVFIAEVERVFKIKDFNLDNDYILTGLENSSKISETDLLELKELAENNYINFNENPVIEGEITGIEDNIEKELSSVIGEIPTNFQFKNSGLVLLTIDQWKKTKKIANIEFEETAGAVFPIKPSLSYLISTFYKKLDVTQNGNEIEVKGELHQPVFELFNKHFGLSKQRHSLIFEFQNAENLFELVSKLEEKGVELPKPTENKIIFTFGESYYENWGTDLGFENFRLKRVLKRYFPDAEFSTSYTTTYSFDFAALNEGAKELDMNEDAFWNELYAKIHGDDFQISQSRRTLSFVFASEENLEQKLEEIKSFDFVDIYDRGDDHKFKFKIKFDMGLQELQAHLNKEYPNLDTKLIANGKKLIFRQFYKTGNKSEILSRLRNKLDEAISYSNELTYIINDTFQEKYLCEENFDLKEEQEEEKLSKLLREEFFFSADNREKFYLGRLQKVDYPELHFVIDEERLDELKGNIEQKAIKAIFPNLKGNKDKIKRLEDTVNKLDSDVKLPNDNAKEFLYDSSKAKAIENIEYLLNKTSAEWQDFENNLFSSSLNESQRQAIYKSLYAEEFALIQGPPGTGKSTAIAEIIWQHIRKNQKEKILLTSETNLAVDNAIFRLKNRENNFVKPIRFGNDEKLESEGYFYSLTAINKWKSDKETQINAVSHWIENISNRVSILDDEEINSALRKWKKHLQNPRSGTKKLFADKYLEYVNLIGATGSSIGKSNSEGKPTSFFHSYLATFEPAKYDRKDWRACFEVNIAFDTVIMDEASKATPPELALPVLYGKKAIIVGDHRQLPPMVDGEEIKDLLMSIGEKKLAKTLSHKEFEKSQFERLFESVDESIKGTFNTQYRMHPAINEVIRQFYIDDGGLNCGLPLEESFHNSFDQWNSRYHGLSFENIISPQTHVMWVDVNTPEIKEGTSRVNFGEIKAINSILTILNNSNGKKAFDEWLSGQSEEEKQIGIISFYGKQISYINKMLKEDHNDNPIRLSTVDRFQGMERNIVIVSMVRSNKIASSQNQEANYDLYSELGYPNQPSLGFAEFPNRLNVALSRARRLLIIVGNSEHFCQKDTYKNVFEAIKKSEYGKIIKMDELQGVLEHNG